jgi:hypothetical protein
VNPDLIITVSASQGRLDVNFTNTRQKDSLLLPLGLSTLKLTQLRHCLATGLERFVGIISRTGEVVKDPKIAIEAIKQLYATGAELGYGLFKDMCPDIEALFTRLCPTWRDAGTDSYVPPWVALQGPLDFPLPLEFIPLFNSSEPDWSKESAYTEIAARFPAFSTIFTRAASDRNFALNHDDILPSPPGLLVRLFHNAGLPGAAKEKEKLEAALGTGLRGPWPSQELPPDDFIKILAEQLYNARSRDDTIELGHPDHIQHFVCHCDTDKPVSRDYTITLAHRTRSWFPFSKSFEHSVTLAQLQSKLFSLLHVKRDDARPLIFLNACGSSKVTAEGVTSFPGLFIDLRNRGVIGSEAAVPDLAAAEFAGEFYKLFVKESFSLGESVYRARIKLLHDSFNPVGILYSVYADPSLYVKGGSKNRAGDG